MEARPFEPSAGTQETEWEAEILEKPSGPGSEAAEESEEVGDDMPGITAVAPKESKSKRRRQAKRNHQMLQDTLKEQDYTEQSGTQVELDIEGPEVQEKVPLLLPPVIVEKGPVLGVLALLEEKHNSEVQQSGDNDLKYEKAEEAQALQAEEPERLEIPAHLAALFEKRDKQEAGKKGQMRTTGAQVDQGVNVDRNRAAMEEALSDTLSEVSRSQAKRENNTVLWGVAIAFALCALVVGAFGVLLMTGEQEAVKENKVVTSVLENPLAEGLYYGYKQSRGKAAEWWLAKVKPTDARNFLITWNGPGVMDGAGRGAGRGWVTPEGKIHIEVSEEIIQKSLFNFNLMAGDERKPMRLMVLEGRVYGKGKEAYLAGDFIQRGTEFQPQTPWVLDQKLPKGWRPPGS